MLRTVKDFNNYTADVEFTLLTFSYFGAKASKIGADDWFFYWKVFGSIMGLPPETCTPTMQKPRIA